MSSLPYSIVILFPSTAAFTVLKCSLLSLNAYLVLIMYPAIGLAFVVIDTFFCMISSCCKRLWCFICFAAARDYLLTLPVKAKPLLSASLFNFWIITSLTLAQWWMTIDSYYWRVDLYRSLLQDRCRIASVSPPHLCSYCYSFNTYGLEWGFTSFLRLFRLLETSSTSLWYMGLRMTI